GRAVVVDGENLVRIIDVTTGKVLRRTRLPDDTITGELHGVQFLDGGNKLLFAYHYNVGWGTAFQTYEIKDNRTSEFRCLAVNNEKTKDIVLAPGGRFAYSCDNDGQVFRYDIAEKTRELIRKLPYDLHAIALFPDGEHVAVGGWSDSITILPTGASPRKKA